jgi:hypothetical protein
VKRRHVSILALAVTLLAGACSSQSNTIAPAPRLETTTTTALSASATPAAQRRAAPRCEPAMLEIVAAIENGFYSPHSRLHEAFTASEGDLAFTSGNVYDANGRLTDDAEVWVVTGGTVYSLTGAANEISNFADGRNLRGHPLAGDELPEAAAHCSSEAARLKGQAPG